MTDQDENVSNHHLFSHSCFIPSSLPLSQVRLDNMCYNYSPNTFNTNSYAYSSGGTTAPPPLPTSNCETVSSLPQTQCLSLVSNPPPPSSPRTLLPSSSQSTTLYTAVISPKEMAAHEAVNFKNVKGVYKNCRGIWAAQWTDERGQRHTKYFNPKYFSTEAEARHEAFRFKIHIAREIELRGGVQKKKAVSTANCRPSDIVLGQSYARDRQRRTQRKVAPGSNQSKLIGSGHQTPAFTCNYEPISSQNFLPYTQPYDPLSGSNFALNTGGINESNHVSSSFIDEIMLQHSFDQMQSTHQTPQDFIHYGSTNVIPSHFDGFSPPAGSPTTKSSNSSPQSMTSDTPSTQTTNQLYRTRIGFDSIYNNNNSTTSNGYQHPFSSSPILGVSQSTSPNALYVFQNNNNHLQQQQQNEKSLPPSLPFNISPSLTFCLCGCSYIAIPPARYAAHHKLTSHMSQNCVSDSNLVNDSSQNSEKGQLLDSDEAAGAPSTHEKSLFDKDGTNAVTDVAKLTENPFIFLQNKFKSEQNEILLNKKQDRTLFTNQFNLYQRNHDDSTLITTSYPMLTSSTKRLTVLTSEDILDEDESQQDFDMKQHWQDGLYLNEVTHHNYS